ncbi:hypothetical protein NEUTE2DRAFT_159933 [Neurospora tetrasperma FGSC 2509]|nr:hypothetical protein NEUTE2DRAFT_159933 [Neurospora tetrasperma FGSC 2509]
MSTHPGSTARGPSRAGGSIAQPQNRSATPYGQNHAGSAIPRPVLETNHAATGSEVGSASVSVSRQKQSKRDEAIRRKMESDLSKKKHLTSRARHTRKAPPGTVLALKPSPALQIKAATTVSEAAQLMAAKREDCVLVTDDDERIAGIFTAKDLAFRVVGGGLKANTVTIAEIMTKNPLCARTDTSATDALDLMVRKGFRHLPVMDENQDISGILDITKCFYDAMEKLERAYASSRRLYDALEGVQSELGTSQPQQIIQYVEALRSKMSGPTLESVLNGIPPTTVSVRTSVKEAAQLMKENHTTAVLVQDQGAITGIFTSKDVVLRVIAPGLDPATCSVVRVMTPHPDFAPMDMTIQAALRKMHDGHYLNLPVMNDAGEIVGMVDVLKLTYATLEQINTMGSGTDNEGPAWNKFWLSLDHETESMVSGDGSLHHTHHGPRSLMSPDIARSERIVDSVAPGDSASHAGVESPSHSQLGGIQEVNPADIPFPFKFKAPSGRVHRLQVTASHGMAEFVAAVAAKLGAEVDAIGGTPEVENGRLSGGFALSYLDDEGDSVSITTDQDLLEAILLARHGLREKVDLFVHDPSEPAISHAPTPAPVIETIPATPPASSVVRERRKKVEEESEEVSEEEEPVHRRPTRTRTMSQPQEQPRVIAGVPNELLLPGAIVTLAVVIVSVFTVSRLTSSPADSQRLPDDDVSDPSISTMIVRNIGARLGRRALATPLSRASFQAQSRFLSQDNFTAPPPPTNTKKQAAKTAFAEPTLEEQAEFYAESIEKPTPEFAASPAAEAWSAPSATATETVTTWDPSLVDEEALKLKQQIEAIPGNFKLFKQTKAQTQKLGAGVEVRYIPEQYLRNPPSDASLEDLMAAQAHMGHNTSLWNPANARYIYGVRQGIHIISLETTATHLRRAARVVEEVAYRGGLILFVGTRPGQRPIVVRAAELAKACHLFTKWRPGTITNREQLLGGVPLTVVDELDRPLSGFEDHLHDRRPLAPDLVVCLNPKENMTLLYECSLAKIPTIGIIDTNTNPSWVTYQIPANDDSLRATALISGVLGRAGERGQKRRLEAAQRGVVTWKTPADVQGYFELASARAADARRRQAQDNSVEEQKEKDTFLSEDALKAMFGGDARV